MHSNRPKRGTQRINALTLVLALLLAPLLTPLLGLAPTRAHAASGDCTTSGTDVTCTFDYTGAAQFWTAPAGVTSATFDLYGAQGGSGGGDRFVRTGSGGLAGAANATLSVTPGATYQINVGGAGGNGSAGAGGAGGTGGFNGGAPGGIGDSFSGGSGGGGGGGYYGGGGGGAAPFGQGGGGGTQTGGGLGGASSNGCDPGGDGSSGVGGPGGNGNKPNPISCGGSPAGNGGSGGGSTGANGVTQTSGAGGGGGSGYGPTGVVFQSGVRTGNGLIIITYTTPTDTTAPMIMPTVIGTPGTNGWYTSDVTVSWSVADSESAIASQTGCGPQTITSDTEGVVFTCTATSAGGSSTQSVTIKRDATAPTISAGATSSPNANGWYNGDVTVAFTCADALSGVASCPANQTLSGEGASISSTAQSVSDRAGNTSAPSNVVSVQIDRTAPSASVTGVTNGASYPLGSVPAPGCSTTDALSGVATAASLSVSGSGVGSYTATCAGASDLAGNSAAAVSVSYRVAYSFAGFFSPVDNLPTVNTANGGRAIPLKWRVTDASGAPITNLTSVSVTSVAGGCSASASADTVEEYATSTSGLLNQGNGYYQFNWKTEKGWGGSCRTLRLDLGDGVLHTALFQFR